MTASTARRGRRVVTALALALPGLAACTASYRTCPAPPAARALSSDRQRLSRTGLYRDIRSETLEDGVRPYSPSFELYSDGASKQRWIWLPPGSAIDARDMDAWQFPAGTKLWKEFAFSGVRVETRLLEKTGPAASDWLAMAYVWSADGSDAVAAPEGAVDARGTAHDVPRANDCMGCHGGTESRVLGFSAIQLSHTAPPGTWSLAELAQERRLVGHAGTVPDIPGDERTRRVLGYLHANCGHCHNQHRPPEPEGRRCFNPRRDFELSLRVGELGSVRDTAVHCTAIGRVIEPGEPESSPLYRRARGDLSLFQARMPPLATETLDPTLLPLLDAWIRALPSSAP
jgi:hypothetical protein